MKTPSKMNRASRSLTILCSVGVLLVGSIATSFAAGSTATPKSTAKTTAKATPSSSAKTAAKSTPTPTAKKSATPKIALPSTGASGQRGAGRFGNITAAQRTCLAGQGVKLPTAPAGGVRPSGAPSAGATPKPGSTPPNFGGGARGTFNSPKTTAAFKKCGIVLPTFGGGGFSPNDPKFLAFQKCMTTAGFKPTGGFGGYDQADPDTAVALIKCQKSSGFTLPKRG